MKKLPKTHECLRANGFRSSLPYDTYTLVILRRFNQIPLQYEMSKMALDFILGHRRHPRTGH
jgi:hypothetical protein